MKNVFTLLFTFITCSLSAQVVGLQVVNDAILEKTLTIGQATMGTSALNVTGSISLTERIAMGDAQGSLFIGNAAGDNNTGASNTAVGIQSMQLNNTGFNNTAFGALSLTSNDEGENNTAIGFTALTGNDTGDGNTAIGTNSLKANKGGGNNTAVGIQALEKNVSASNNVAVGALSLNSTEQAGDNVAVGFSALFSTTTGTQNVGVGHTAMNANTQGFNNTAIGGSALNANTIGDENVAVGTLALGGIGNDEGNKNTAVGFNAFNNNDISAAIYNNSTAIGANTEIDGSNQIRLGDMAIESIGGWKPWTDLSNPGPILFLKGKKEVPGLAFIELLEPISYQTQTKSGVTIQKTAFHAQDVVEAAAEIDYDFDGVDIPASGKGVYGIRYATFVVPLVQAVKELNATNEALETENATQQATIKALEERMDKLESLLTQFARSGLEERTMATEVVTLSDVQLAQNNPNPFSDFTTIPYYLPESVKEATLKITNANGQIIKVIPISNRGKGEVVLETKLLGQGTYFYTLMIDGVTQETKQMVLQK